MGALYRATMRGESPRGVWREPGETFEHEGKPGKWMEKVGGRQTDDDHDDGEPKPKPLKMMNKAALLDVAASAGIEKAKDKDGNEIPVSDATNKQIVAAIEASRGA